MDTERMDRAPSVRGWQAGIHILAGLSVLSGLYLSSLYSYLLFHSLAEIFSVVVACGIFMFAWNSRRFLENGFFLWLGVAYLFVGSMDLVHALAYRGMGVFPGYDANLPTQLWIAGRYVESLSLLVAPLFLGRKLRPGVVFCGYTGVFTLLLGAIFYANVFPDCLIEGVGLTPFKRISEYVISLILLASIAATLQKHREFDRNVLQFLVTSIAVTIASEWAFTLYTDPYGTANLIGHFLKVVSFYLVYKATIETGMVKPYNLLFRDLKQSETALRLSEERLRMVIENAEDMIAMHDLDGRYLYFHGPSRYGIDSSHVIGKTPFDLFGAEEAEPIVEQIRKVAASGEGITAENRVTRQEETLWFSDRIYPVRDGSGEITAVARICRNVTEQRRMEQQLIHLERLHALKELSAGISHNMNNILTSVLGPAQLLQRISDDPRVLREAEDIVASTRRAGDLIHRLRVSVLDVADDRLHAVHINEVVLGAVEAARPRWKDEPESRGVSIEVVTDLHDVLPVRGTASGLYDIVLNLLFNAVEAMPDGGTATVCTRASDGEVRLAVSDTGIGMDEATRTRVFEPFFTTKRDVGSGLGLSTVYGRVSSWGGGIEVESSPGGGATFSLTFPVWTEPEAPGEDRGIARPVRRGSILVVDDDEGTRRFLSRLLSGDHEVKTVRSGQEAREVFAPGRYDVALIDLGMPGTPGDEVVRQLREADPSLSTILITGWSVGDVGARLAVFDFRIQKPFEDLGRMQDMVRRAVALHDARAAG